MVYLLLLLLLLFLYSDLSNVAKNPCIHAISIQELKGVSVKREPGTCGTLRMANGIVWNLIANRKVGTDKIFIKKKGDTPWQEILNLLYRSQISIANGCISF